jgi:hypothetical protein
MSRRSMKILMRGSPVALVLACVLTAGRAGAQGVTAALMPATQIVEPGTGFDIELQVTQAGSSFNGFGFTLAYDPAAVTLVPLSQQAGSLMTDTGCNQFQRFLVGVDRDTISDILLCAGVSLTGPGQLYKLHFQASTTAQTTTIWIVPGSIKFYNAGLFVTPVSSSDAQVEIRTALSVDGNNPASGGLLLAAAPNPSRGKVVFTIGRGGSGPESLTVRDVRGAAIRTLSVVGRQVAWDGLRDSGEAAANGVYFATLKADGSSTTIRVSLIR